ncbi:hypothetical protein D3C81_1476410 [compost metagenome]
MQAAHDQANLIRLKYEDKVYRTFYVDYYSGTPSKKRATASFSRDMYNELLYGNAREIGLLDDPVLNAMGFIIGPGKFKAAYTITADATKAIFKHWGKTNGKKAVDAFTKSAAKGFVSKEGANGIKQITGFSKNGKWYSVEIKVKNKQFGDYRVYGYKDKAGNFIFDFFDKALH